MIFRRLRNLWRLSAYEPVSDPLTLEWNRDENMILVPTIKPVKKAEIIKKTNAVEDFLNK